MNRRQSLLYTVRGCLITTFCSLHFDGRNTDTVYRESYINDFLWPWWRFTPSKYCNSVSCALTAWLATLAAFLKPTHIYQPLLETCVLDISRSLKFTQHHPHIFVHKSWNNEENNSKLFSNYDFAQNFFI